MALHELAGIRLDTFEPCARSPRVDDAFRGLRLEGAASIMLGGDSAPFPVFGTYQVGAAFLNRFTSMSNEIVVVAVDARSHVPFSTNLLRPGFDAEPSRFDASAKGFDRIVVTGWFNLDLFHWMVDLPRRAGRYHVFSTIGDVASNVITVELGTP